MIQKTLLIISIVFLIQSCKIGTSGIWKNGNIDKGKRDQIKALNDKLFKAIESNDPANLKAMMSDSLIQKSGDIDQFLSQVSASFKADNYTIFDEYYIHNSTTGIINTIPPSLSGNNDFVINYLALNKDMYVSLLLANRLDNEVLIMAVYGNYSNEWKLNILKIGQYSLFKKNAPDYYKLAKACYDKSYLVDAYINIRLSEQLLRPANDIFVYQKEKDINEFYDKIRSELNTKYPLPLTLENISTKPKIFRIYPEMGEEGFCPMVQYLTDLSLKDTILLKAENEKIKKEIKNLFNGIDQDKKYIFFQAFNELPDGRKLVEHYGFIDQLTK